MKNMNTKNLDMQTVYSEPKDPNAVREKKDRKPFVKNYNSNREETNTHASNYTSYTEKKVVDEKEYDSDGFEIVGKDKKENVQKKPYTRPYRPRDNQDEGANEIAEGHEGGEGRPEGQDNEHRQKKDFKPKFEKREFKNSKKNFEEAEPVKAKVVRQEEKTSTLNVVSLLI